MNEFLLILILVLLLALAFLSYMIYLSEHNVVLIINSNSGYVEGCTSAGVGLFRTLYNHMFSGG